jgi:hypothetical protein
MKSVKFSFGVAAGLMALAAFSGLFSCDDDELRVTVTTRPVTNISTTTATSGGTVEVSDAAVVVSERGVVWSENPNPTTAGLNKTSDGTGTGEFTSSITRLQNSSEYFVRAYAVVNGHTHYGDQVTFATLQPIELIRNGSLAEPANAAGNLVPPWLSEERTDDDRDGVHDWVGFDNRTPYKGRSGWLWTYDWAKGFYQIAGHVPSVETDYRIAYDYTCTWNAWGDYRPVTVVIFSVLAEGANPANRVEVGRVRFTEPAFFPGWDNNTWATHTGTFRLTQALATQHANKRLVIEWDVLYETDDATFWSDVWYNFDNFSVRQQ